MCLTLCQRERCKQNRERHMTEVVFFLLDWAFLSAFPTNTCSVWCFLFSNSQRSDWLCKLTLYPFWSFPPTSVCSFLPASLCATISILLLYLFFLHSLSLSQPSFPFLCHFPSTSPCHYSAHMSRLKRRPLLPACVISFCGGASLTPTFWECMWAYAHACLCASLFAP